MNSRPGRPGLSLTVVFFAVSFSFPAAAAGAGADRLDPFADSPTLDQAGLSQNRYPANSQARKSEPKPAESVPGYRRLSVAGLPDERMQRATLEDRIALMAPENPEKIDMAAARRSIEGPGVPSTETQALAPLPSNLPPGPGR